MNGWLIVLRMAHDDLPLRLFGELEQAKTFIANSVTADGYPTDELIELVRDTVEEISFSQSEMVRLDAIYIVNGYMAALAHTVVFAE
jgi:hypothetical protein